VIARKWGSAIRAQRTAVHMTQEQLAAAVGVTQRAVSLWEMGRAAPTVDRQVRIAQALKVDARVLFQYPDAA
jgi:transcriptional regulator with XRE-family HTH domain